MPEHWLPIPDLPGYDVSDHGRVRSYYRRAKGQVRIWELAEIPQRILKQATHTQYPYVILRRTLDRWTVKIHTLVLLAFVGPRPDGLVCCHADGNPFNNHLDNLRWDTPSANVQDMIRHGRYKNGPALAARKFTAKEIVQIRRQRASGLPFTALSERWGIGPMPIFYICVGETYKDCAGPITPRRTGQVGG